MQVHQGNGETRAGHGEAAGSVVSLSASQDPHRDGAAFAAVAGGGRCQQPHTHFGGLSAAPLAQVVAAVDQRGDDRVREAVPGGP